MNNSNLGVISYGIKSPLIKNGDDIIEIVFKSVVDSGVDIDDGDIIGITESVVARSSDNYVTVDQIVKEIGTKINNKSIALWSPIMSRNRFSLILRAFARYADKLIIFIDEEADEQGNPTYGENPFTGVDMQKYYQEICNEEKCTLCFKSTKIYMKGFTPQEYNYTVIDARCHPDNMFKYTLKDFCNDISEEHGFTSYGLLGSNKAGDELLKLFPEYIHSQYVVNHIQNKFYDEFGKKVEVMIYGDGSYKDPESYIWEMADPISCVAHTAGLVGTPNEVKLKYLIDNTNSSEEVINTIKENRNKNLVGTIESQGTTPRKYVNLLSSLMDLMSGSGDKGTPIVFVKNYFKKYTD